MKFRSTAIILSGGKSNRMGENKSLMKLQGKTIIEHSVLLMKSLFSNVILITNESDNYKFLDIPIYRDIFKENGPLAGIHTGLFYSQSERNFIISCDLPLMNKKTVEYIMKFKSNKPITLYKADGYIQQLAGVYSKTLLPTIENILENESKHSVYSLIDRVKTEIIEIGKLDLYKQGVFFNMNRPEDYKKILSMSNLLAK